MIINRFVVGFVEGINYVQYVVVYVSVEVVDVYVWFVRQFFYRYDVIVRQIYYVDVIAYVSIIFGRIIVIKNRQRVATVYSNLGDVWYQVIRNVLRIFVYIVRRMRVNRVEVAQQGNVLVRLGFLQIGEDLFYYQFVFVVRVLRCVGREVFNVWNFGLIVINGGGGVKNKVFDVSGAYGVNQAQSVVDIVVVIFQRFLYRFVYGFQFGEVDYGVDSVIVQDFGY